jgi:release factor glutamine methyltransferase
MNEAELLFTEVFCCSRISLYQGRRRPLSKYNGFKIASVLKRRILGEPLQYILGKTEFMGIELKVNPDVLIPRPETEILVEKTIKLASGISSEGLGLEILDLGTGSGCIAVSLAKFLPRAKVTAVDISEKALAIAQENAKLNNVADKITFLESDLFSNHELADKKYDLIASNPPYIRAKTIAKLQPEIAYEPRIALDGGKSGLVFYRRIINAADNYLKIGGLFIMEIGFQQKEAIKNIFQKSKNFAIIDIMKDYQDIDRVIIAKRLKKNG